MVIIQSSDVQPIIALRTLLMLVLLLSSATMLAINGEELPMTETDTPWKYDFEVISSPQYVAVFELLYCDEEDRLWAAVNLNFAEMTDAYHARSRWTTLISEDQGVTWQVSDEPWPAAPRNRVILPDGTIVEFGSSGYERHPRSEISRLQEEGYHVWDLGEEAGYCAIIYDMWVRRSTDGGQTWEEQPIHKQLPFMAHLVGTGYPILVDDSTLLYWAYGFAKKQSYDTTPHRRCNAYALRSTDAGRTWEMIEIADGANSSADAGFTEIYPLYLGGGRVFAMLRTALGANAFSTYSTDGGATWSDPQGTPIIAKHPIPTLLRDGAIVCTYQRRFAPPFGIRARFTSDLGETWSDEVILRDDIQVSDGLSNPTTVELSDGTLVTLFGAKKRLDDGSCQIFVGGTRWSRNYQPLPQVQEKLQQIQARGSWSPEFPLPPLEPVFNLDRRGKSPWWQPEPEQP